MVSATGINWLSLTWAILQSIYAIQVAPDSSLIEEPNITHAETITHSDNETLVGDSQLSASERNRRLIPYMAFYLPAADIPINQQYVPTQHQHKGTKSQHDASAGPLPPPTAITIPTAYVHMKLPAAATATTLQYQQQHQQKQRQQFPHSTGEVYHSIAYGGQHPLPVGFKEGGVGGGKEIPVLHMLAPGTSSSLAHTGSNQYKEAIGTQHKSVVYQPNTATHHQHEEQQLQLTKQQYRQPPKQSKINLTPFTSSNSVPGHFIPIIYTPLSSTKEDSIHYKSNPEAIDEHRQFQQELQQHHQQQHEQKQKQQQIVQHTTQYSLPPSASSSAVGQPHRHPVQHQVQFLTVTPTAVTTTTGIHPTPSPIYRVINEQPSDSLKHQHHAFDTHSNNPQFQPPKPENFFDNEQYRNADNMTPQQKYVMYLQQRMRYNKQQQKLPERTKDRHRQQQQYFKYQPEQQRPQIFVISSTAAPTQEVEDDFMQLREPLQQQHQQQSMKYPQHSPVGHAVYPRPELPVPANHQAQPQQHQQLLHIPVQPEFIQQYSRTHSGSQRHQPGSRTPAKQHFVEQYQNGGSPVPPQYIDYIIEEPKQLLEDEHQQQQQIHYRPYAEQSSKHSHTHGEPQSAYIIITTAAPYAPEAPPRELQTTAHRPLYKNQPNLRLKPVQQLSNHSPSNFAVAPHTTKAPALSVSISPQYVYPSRPNKIRPPYDYDEDVVQPVKRPSPPPPPPISPTAPPAVDTEFYRPPITPEHHQQPPIYDPNPLPDIRSSSLADILHKLQASNHLPKTLTPDNIDNSIKTLITILNNLKHSQTIVPNPPQHHETPHTVASPDYDYTTGSEENVGEEQDIAALPPTGPTVRPGPNTGKPGVDYPNYAEIPATAFSCADQRYKGFFGDPETNCQVWHYCDLNGGKASFLCPNGTIFSQIALTCDWWFNVKCSTTSQLYVLNERLYKYILPFNPKFPEDYSGPIVDKYLALKFQEMEEKMRQEKQKAAEAVAAAEAAVEEDQISDTETDPSNIEVETTTAPTTLSSQPQEHHSVNSQVGEQSSERNLLIDDEVDDISQRGSVNEDGSSTAFQSANKEEELPLSKKPIVVTSTPEQELESKNAEPTYESSEQYGAHTPQKTPTPRETTKISVEKVEVIEIKPEGLAEILKPVMIFSTKEASR